MPALHFVSDCHAGSVSIRVALMASLLSRPAPPAPFAPSSGHIAVTSSETGSSYISVSEMQLFHFDYAALARPAPRPL